MFERSGTLECTADKLHIIKQKFRSEICSERLMDKIDSLMFLLKVLDRRAVGDIQSLSDILNKPLASEDTQQIVNHNCDFRIEFVEPVTSAYNKSKVQGMLYSLY